MHKAEIVVAGHVCLDFIPQLESKPGVDLIEPGKLLRVGAAQISTGGTVSNVGIALRKLGISVRLMGKVGDDLFGQAIIERFRQIAPELPERMLRAEGQTTSYTVVVNPPGRDRSFWHHPGTNDTYTASDVQTADLIGARLFHFGYPPLMERMYADEGRELVELFRKVKAAGLISSLDMAYPDPDSPAGQADWPKILANVLPYVDIFLPSLDEILFMIDRPKFIALTQDGSDLEKQIDELLLRQISDSLIGWGAAIVGLKLGSRGFYLRTTAEKSRLPAILGDADTWTDREMISPCFKVNVRGTTGSGDCTIAGFLAAFVKMKNPEDTVNAAVGTGACNVEALDATSGIPDWETLQGRIKSGWSKHPLSSGFTDWRWNGKDQLARGHRDRGSMSAV